jgi:ketosteroid isomerase-like protein
MFIFMKKSIFFILTLFLMASCRQKNDKNNKQYPELKAEMIETDRAFSEMSKEVGMKKAFLEYIDSDGVLLRPNTMPLIGADAMDYISQADDTSYIMTWEPQGGSIAASGDLGYTYGVYSVQPKNKDTLIRGTYLSVWKKQKDGKWKFVVDTGNEGIGDRE